MRFDENLENQSEIALKIRAFQKILTIGRKLIYGVDSGLDLTADTPPQRCGSKKKTNLHQEENEMQMSDVIADMLTRIRNASNAKHATVDIPASNMKKSIADILVE